MVMLRGGIGVFLGLVLSIGCSDISPDDDNGTGPETGVSEIPLNGLPLDGIVTHLALDAALAELAQVGFTAESVAASARFTAALLDDSVVPGCPGEAWPYQREDVDLMPLPTCNEDQPDVCPTVAEITEKFLDYLYSCAMPAGEQMTVEVGGKSFTFEGGVGLAPEWGASDGAACDDDCRGWVSACILARSQAYRCEMQVSLRGDHPALAPSDSTLEEFWIKDASFYGDVFAGQFEDNLFACAGGRSAALPMLDYRVCGAVGGGPEGGRCETIKSVTDCGDPLESMVCAGAGNACRSHVSCQEWDAGGQPTRCYTDRFRCGDPAPAQSREFTRIITAYFKPLPATCGNGVCESSEDQQSCPQDCTGQVALSFGSACHEEVAGVGVDTAGHIAVAGSFIGSIDLPGLAGLVSDPDDPAAETRAFFAVGIDTEGEYRWATAIGPELPAGQDPPVARRAESLTSIAVSPAGDVVVAGASTELESGQGRTDFFVASFEPDEGRLVWIRHFPGGSAFASAARPDPRVAIDPGGTIAFATHFRTSIRFGDDTRSSGHLAVARLGPDGSILASETYGNRAVRVNGLAVGPGGRLGVVGTFGHGSDTSVRFAPGTKNLQSAGGVDGFVLALDADLTVAWAEGIGGPGYDGLQGVAVDASGRIAVAGRFTGTADAGACTVERAGAASGVVARFGPGEITSG
jgi:hypothetical protein